MRNNDIAFWMVAQRIIPLVVVVLPLFIMFNFMALIDSHFGMILLYMVIHVPIAAWVMFQYFKQIPVVIEESARIDGATDLQISGG